MVVSQDRTMKWTGWSGIGMKNSEYANKLHLPVDTILLGRKMTSDFISYWFDVINKPDDPEYSIAKKMVETPKIVLRKH